MGNWTENGGVILVQSWVCAQLFPRRNSQRGIMQIFPAPPRSPSVWPVVCSCGWTMWHASSWKTTVYSPARLPFLQHQLHLHLHLELQLLFKLQTPATRPSELLFRGETQKTDSFYCLGCKIYIISSNLSSFCQRCKERWLRWPNHSLGWIVRASFIYLVWWLMDLIGWWHKKYYPLLGYFFMASKWFPLWYLAQALNWTSFFTNLPLNILCASQRFAGVFN